MASDSFTGSVAALATHDSNWTSGPVDPVSGMGIDGSGFCVATASFGTNFVHYATGASSNGKSEIIVPIGAFVTLNNAGEFIGVTCQAGAATRGFNAYIAPANLTGQVINSVRVASDSSFITTQALSPTINTASVALTMSLQRTSTTNVDLIVNGTTYHINTTGVDITSGVPGIVISRNSASATTLKIDSWNDGASAPATLSSATPSGTLGTSTSATLGATSDQTTGNFYGVVDTAGNISGITASQVKAGQNNAGAAPVASSSATVSTTSPATAVSGLSANTLYSYAVVQNNANGDSNVLTGTFTTATAAVNPQISIYGPKGALRTIVTL